MTTTDSTPEVQIAELQTRITQQQAQIQRLWDLVRYSRHDLYQAQLISDDELSALFLERPGSVNRLETYDEMRVEIARLRDELKARP